MTKDKGGLTMEKKTYVKPEMEVVELENDVILTSGEVVDDDKDGYGLIMNETGNYTVMC